MATERSCSDYEWETKPLWELYSFLETIWFCDLEACDEICCRKRKEESSKKVHHVLPILSAISAARSPQMPLTAVRTLSPASTALKRAHSIAVWPVPLTAKVIMFRVWNMYWIPLLMSFIIWHAKWTNVDSKFLCTPAANRLNLSLSVFIYWMYLWIGWFLFTSLGLFTNKPWS